MKRASRSLILRKVLRLILSVYRSKARATRDARRLGRRFAGEDTRNRARDASERTVADDEEKDDTCRRIATPDSNALPAMQGDERSG
jgi:hypothetical protein